MLGTSICIGPSFDLSGSISKGATRGDSGSSLYLESFEGLFGGRATSFLVIFAFAVFFATKAAALALGGLVFRALAYA